MVTNQNRITFQWQELAGVEWHLKTRIAGGDLQFLANLSKFQVIIKKSSQAIRLFYDPDCA
jgi:hypothetical protein